MTAEELREAILEHGGIVGAADIARRFKTTRSTVHLWTHDLDFPEPLGTSQSRPVWLARDIDTWRANRRDRRRRLAEPE